jgi:hypothetical protein
MVASTPAAVLKTLYPSGRPRSRGHSDKSWCAVMAHGDDRVVTREAVIDRALILLTSWRFAIR